MLMRKMKANVMRNATKKNKKNYFIVFDYYILKFYLKKKKKKKICEKILLLSATWYDACSPSSIKNISFVVFIYFSKDLNLGIPTYNYIL